MSMIGVKGLGIYLPKHTMNAETIASKTNGRWTTEAIKEKLGIHQIYKPGKEDGTQEMAVKAALEALKSSKTDPKTIDLILSIGEEWKEYPLTTTALYIQDKIGAIHAWGIDLQNRCSTGISALKIAKDMMMSDSSIKTVLIAGGYRNSDLIDFTDKDVSFMYNLSSGGGAIILEKDYPFNELMGSHLIADGSLSRSVLVPSMGTKDGSFNDPYLRLKEPELMKQKLNEVSLDNWFKCLDHALDKSNLKRSDIDYLNILHIKRSGHLGILKALDLNIDQSVYLEDYGHLGQLDQILSLKLGLDQGKIKEGSVVAMLAAGVGYVWGASIIKWGPYHG